MNVRMIDSDKLFSQKELARIKAFLVSEFQDAILDRQFAKEEQSGYFRVEQPTPWDREMFLNYGRIKQDCRDDIKALAVMLKKVKGMQRGS